MSLAPSLEVCTTYDYPVPMRDGVVLRGTLFRPAAAGRCPVLLLRTPYGTQREGYERYVRAGYAVYAQDCRGRYTSDGAHQVMPLDHGSEAPDGCDTVAHLAAQPWSDGRVGLMGASYGGFTAWECAGAQPPGLLGLNAETIPAEMADVDYTGGSFRLARRLHWWYCNLAPDWRRRLGLPGPQTTADARRAWQEQVGAQLLGLLPVAGIAELLPEPLARDVRAWFADPAMRPWRFAERVYPRLTMPNLDVSGWYDHCNGSIDHLAAMQRLGGSPAAREQTKLVLGPWNHTSRGNRQLGDFDFGPGAAVDLVDLRLRWFDRWVKGEPNGVDEWPAVQYFEMGSHRWLSAATWPPPSRPEAWFLAAETLQPEASGETTTREYVYDPREATPTLWGPELFTLPVDRRKLDYRADLLRYRSATLAAPLRLAGHPEVVLHATTSAPDTDFFAWLVDEAPDGRATPLCQGMVRARFRDGLDRPTLLTPGLVARYQLKLGAIAHCFLPGHRLRLDVASADFPNYDRNHNTGGHDLFEATLAPARQTILAGGAHPSHLLLPRTD